MYTSGDVPVPGFRLVKRLGRGGFGEVWKATGPGGTEAAIKVINLGNHQGLKEFRAIHLVKQIRHPNLVPILAFWIKDEDGRFYEDVTGIESTEVKAQAAELIIAMGLGDKSLMDRLKECKRGGTVGIPLPELLGYMEDSARAIDHLNQPTHDLGAGPVAIQHCDIKPQNILIVSGAAQVCDFGLARVLEDTRASGAGSIAYMAPELLLRSKPSRSTDQYSLAISYVELRTGVLPLDARNAGTAIWAHTKGELDFSKLTPREQEVLKKATALEPDDRYGTTVEMVRALREATGEGAPSRKPSRKVDPQELLQVGSEIVPGYKLIRMLGRGGYGEVWEATAPGGKHVALKVIGNLEDVSGKQEFKALELIKGVDHNHLMELHAYWLLDQHGEVIPDDVRGQPGAPSPSLLVIASKLANKNLMQRLHECHQAGETGIPVPELLEYMRQAAQAIDYLNSPQHDLGGARVSIQHRDIKPENILLAGGAVKVGDFSLAKVVEGTSAEIHGDSWGLTVAYAAPEMFSNTVTAWTDQYSLALTYYKLRTGVFPFPPNTPLMHMVRLHTSGQLDLADLADAERQVVLRATRLKPEERYPNCAAFVKALELACGLGSVQAARPPDTAFATTAASPGSGSSPTGFEAAGGTKTKTGDSALVAAPTAELEPGAHPGTATGQETETLDPGSAAPDTVGPRRSRRRKRASRTDFPGATTQQFWLTTQAGVAALLAHAKRHRRAVLVVALLLAVGVAAGGGRLLLSSTLESRLRDRQAAGDYAAALELIDSWDAFLKHPETRRAETLAAWRAEAQAAYDAGDYSRAVELCTDLLGKVPDDPEATVLHDLALAKYLPIQVAELVKQDAFVQALATLEKDGRVLPDGGDGLRTDVRKAWRTKAQREYSDRRYGDALRTCEAIRDRFPEQAADIDKLQQLCRTAFRESLEQAQARYKAQLDPESRQAFEGFRGLLQREDFGQNADLRVQALLGEARAGARLKEWPAVAEALAKLPGELAGRDRAYRSVLKVLAEEGRPGAAGPDYPALLDEVFKLRGPQGPLADLPPEAWEARELAALEDRMLVPLRVVADASIPEDALPLLNKLLTLRPDNAATLLIKAHKQSMRQDYAGCLQTIALAEKVGSPEIKKELSALKQHVVREQSSAESKRLLARADQDRLQGRVKESLSSLDQLDRMPLEDATRRDVKALRALVYAADPDRQANAVELFGELVRLPQPPRPAELVQAFLKLADERPASRKEVLQLLDKALPTLSLGADRDRVLGHYQALRREVFEAALAEADRHFKDNHFAESRKALAEAAAYLPAAAAARVQEKALQALVAAADPKSTGADRNQAFQTLNELVQLRPAPRLRELALALIHLADADAAYQGTTLETLGKVLGDLPAGPVRNELDASFQGLLHKYQANRVQALLAEAGRLWETGDVAGVRKTLAQLERLQPGGADAANVEALKALVWVRDASAKPEERAQAVPLIKKLLASAKPPRPKDLCDALAGLAEAQPQLTDDALAVLNKALPTLPKDDQEPLRDRIGRLASRKVRELIAGFSRQTDFQKVLKECDRAAPTGWVRACRAECLIEKSGGRPDSRDLKLAQEAADAAAVKEAGHYGQYVHALVAASAPGASAATAADEMLQAYSGDTGALLQAPLRRGRAIEILRKAAGSLHAENANPAQPFATKADAERVYQWLARARELTPKGGPALPLDLQVTLALAAWHKPTPDAALAQEMTTPLVSLLQPDRFDEAAPSVRSAAYGLILILAQTEAGGAAGLEAKIKDYSLLLELSKKEKLEPVPPPVQLYADVVQPALLAAEQLAALKKDGSVNSQLARLYADKGSLVRQNRYADWPFQDKEREAFLAFDRAVALDGQRAEYVVQRAYARGDLPKVDWREIEAEARRAIALDRDYAGGPGLLGYGLLQRSRRERDPAKRLQNLRDALAAVEEAMRLSKKADPERLRATFLLNRSLVHLELGNYIIDLQERTPHLCAARDDADQATRLNRRNPEYAWEALGNALEDVAMLGGEKEKYGVALDAFTRAINERPARPHGWVDRGRCHYRRVQDGNQDPKFLDNALEDLDTAIQRSPESRPAAEAYYWKGKVYRYRAETAKPAERTGHYAQAVDFLAKSIELAEKYDSPDWAENALTDAAQIVFVQAQDLFKKKPREADRYLRQARTFAQILQAYNPAVAASEARRVVVLQAEIALREADDCFDRNPELAKKYAEQARTHARELLTYQDFLAAFYLLGSTDETDNPTAALRTYDDALALPVLPGGVLWLMDESYVKVLLKRVDLALTYRLKELTPPAASLVRDAELAVRLAGDPVLKAHALGTAGRARLEAANPAKTRLTENQKRAYQQAAVADLRKAIGMAPDHARAWIWRTVLADQLIDRGKTSRDPEERRGYFQEAKALLVKALEGAPAGPNRDGIRSALDYLQKKE